MEASTGMGSASDPQNHRMGFQICWVRFSFHLLFVGHVPPLIHPGGGKGTSTNLNHPPNYSTQVIEEGDICKYNYIIYLLPHTADKAQALVKIMLWDMMACQIPTLQEQATPLTRNFQKDNVQDFKNGGCPTALQFQCWYTRFSVFIWCIFS